MERWGRPDRKTVEKNRRIQMKALYSQLLSLLPAALTKEENRSPLSMPMRLDVAATYIKVLQERLDKMKARRRRLLQGEKSEPSRTTTTTTSTKCKINVQKLCVTLQVAMTTQGDHWSMFSEVIRLIEEEGAEITSANFSVVGVMATHIILVKAGETGNGFEVGKLLEQLKTMDRSLVS